MKPELGTTKADKLTRLQVTSASLRALQHAAPSKSRLGSNRKPPVHATACFRSNLSGFIVNQTLLKVENPQVVIAEMPLTG